MIPVPCDPALSKRILVAEALASVVFGRLVMSQYGSSSQQNMLAMKLSFLAEVSLFHLAGRRINL